MSDTALDHPLVRAYLRELSEALASLPPQQAAELTDQIAAHLDEELQAGATNDEIAEAISRMGTPAGLARDAGARRTLRAALKRYSWKFYTSVGAVIAAAGVLIGMLVNVETAPILTADGFYGWWFPQDGTREVNTSAAGADQTTVPVRWHQQQGFYVQLLNESGYTQTILGYTSPALNHMSEQLAVSTRSGPRGEPPGDALSEPYGLPVSIPPHQSRYVRVLWTSEGFCVVKNGTFGVYAIALRVRVGWLTRTEFISLPAEFALTGTTDTCPDDG